MRDPKRIAKFCDRLAASWARLPDWRFGQLMVNIFNTLNRDPFFFEDDVMIEIIEKAAEGFSGESLLEDE